MSLLTSPVTLLLSTVGADGAAIFVVWIWGVVTEVGTSYPLNRICR